MTTLLLTTQPDGLCVTPRRMGVRDRIDARLRAGRLDAALANGASPDASAQLSLHAHRLISKSMRWELAGQIRQLLREAERSARPGERRVMAVPICRRKVTDAHSAFEALAETLTRPGPVDACGIAQLRLLLKNGAGPLYCHPHANDLATSLETALDALEPHF